MAGAIKRAAVSQHSWRRSPRASRSRTQARGRLGWPGVHHAAGLLV